MRVSKKILLLSVLICLFSTMPGCTFKNKPERIRKKIKNSLYEKYEEEFIVDRIGTQTIGGRTNYVARIYPKSKLGANGERDSYYSSKLGLEKKPFGRLGKVGSGYDMVMLKMQAEKYLNPKAREIFGKRVLLKSEVKYKWRSSKEIDHFSWKIVSGFKKLLDKVKSNPEKNMIELELYVYVFDRIEDGIEKEERRKDIFDFVQYLKKEDLFEYLELGIIFVDERVLAHSYDKYDRKIFFSDKVEEVVEGEKVELPPMKLRKEISKELQKEINKMSEQELLANMKKIKKDELSYKGIREYNGQYQGWIYSIGMLEERYKSSITEEDRSRKYNKLNDVKLSKYKKYLFLDINNPCI